MNRQKCHLSEVPRPTGTILYHLPHVRPIRFPRLAGRYQPTCTIDPDSQTRWTILTQDLRRTLPVSFFVFHLSFLFLLLLFCYPFSTAPNPVSKSQSSVNTHPKSLPSHAWWVRKDETEIPFSHKSMNFTFFLRSLCVSSPFLLVFPLL